MTPTPLRMQWLQTVLGVPLYVLSGVRWLVYLLAAGAILRAASAASSVLPVVAALVAADRARHLRAPRSGAWRSRSSARGCCSLGLRAGDYPRGGSRAPAALARRAGRAPGRARSASPGAPWITYYARALGAKIGHDVDLHTLPPITGMLTIGAGASIEPEVDLSGYWIDGDMLRLGAIRIGADARSAPAAPCCPAPASASAPRSRRVPPCSGACPPASSGPDRPRSASGSSAAWWPEAASAAPPPLAVRPSARPPSALSLLPLVALAVGGVVVALGIRGSATLGEAVARGFGGLVPATLASGLVLAGLVVVLVRLLRIGVREGTFPVRSRIGWQVWSTERLLDLSRTMLFPLYASLVHAGLAADARGEGRPRRRGLDGAAHARR